MEVLQTCYSVWVEYTLGQGTIKKTNSSGNWSTLRLDLLVPPLYLCLRGKNKQARREEAATENHICGNILVG